jgi:hypothetical protein
MSQRPETRAALERARARLERLQLYPRPLRVERVRIVVSPLFFRLFPWRRYDAYALWRTIVLRRPLAETSEDLLTHELCHIWQAQNHPVRTTLAPVRYRYGRNPYEAEARRAGSESASRG